MSKLFEKYGTWCAYFSSDAITLQEKGRILFRGHDLCIVSLKGWQAFCCIFIKRRI
jgi:hypothetical protein